MAAASVVVLHRPKLRQATLGKVLHAFLYPLDRLDRSLLLPDGLDGKFFCTLVYAFVVFGVI